MPVEIAGEDPNKPRWEVEGCECACCIQRWDVFSAPREAARCICNNTGGAMVGLRFVATSYLLVLPRPS